MKAGGLAFLEFCSGLLTKAQLHGKRFHDMISSRYSDYMLSGWVLVCIQMSNPDRGSGHTVLRCCILVIKYKWPWLQLNKTWTAFLDTVRPRYAWKPHQNSLQKLPTSEFRCYNDAIWTSWRIKPLALGCLFNIIFRLTEDKQQSSVMLALCCGNPPVTDSFPS